MIHQSFHVMEHTMDSKHLKKTLAGLCLTGLLAGGLGVSADNAIAASG